MKKFIYLLLFLLLIIILPACDTKVNQTVSFFTNEVYLKVKQGTGIPVDVINTSLEDIEYSFSEDGIVYIEDGFIKALKAGHTTIYAKIKNNEEVQSQLDVYVEELKVNAPIIIASNENLKVDHSSVMMFKNFNTVGAVRECFDWSVSDEKIATIDNNFVVKAVKEGKVTITATLKSDPTITSSYDLDIVPNDDTKIHIYTSDLTPSVIAGEYLDLHLENINDTEKINYRWQSYSNSIGMITEDGRVIGVKEGIAQFAAFSKENNQIYGIINVIVKGIANVDYAQRIVDVAIAEEGYHEGPAQDNKYGEWYGLNNLDWCAIFVSWAANHSGISTSIVPKYKLVREGKDFFVAEGRFKYKEEYIPKKGDIIFFLSDGASHTGIVTRVENDRVYTIEGNTSNSVAQRSYPLYYSTITGYGVPNYPKYNPVA